MKILVACEFSGIVRDAFIAQGHDAISCDLETSEKLGPHYKGDVRNILYKEWDMVIAFPPCTYLTNSGARWNVNRREEQEKAIDFFLLFTQLTCAWCIENPVGIMSTRYKKPSQIIQPYMYGHNETKSTCLWLHKLPLLQPTKIVYGDYARVHYEAPGPNRQRNRSRTYTGIASAMAIQWTLAN